MSWNGWKRVMSMFVRNRRIIDLRIIRRNMEAIRSALPQNVRILAVVKADAYGHGAAECAHAALRGGADMLAVASVQEGILLREKGIDAPVLVLGAVMEADVSAGVEHDLIQTVCSPEMIHLCENSAMILHRKANVHLKLDTGMGRIGVRNGEEMDAVLTALKQSPHVELSGVFTHFSDADGDADGEKYTRMQFDRFRSMTKALPSTVIRHCCNSAAVHRFPDMIMDMVRVGISLYGYPPVPVRIPLKPAMTWTAKISYIKDLPAGEFISYGRTYQTDHPVRVATVTCGYADGYHRAAGADGYVLIHGHRCKILGRVCMDQMVVDISEAGDVRPGDEAVLIGTDGGETLTAEDLARWAGTISYEILLSAGSRVEREHQEDPEV
jgi:alanine racemase